MNRMIYITGQAGGQGRPRMENIFVRFVSFAVFVLKRPACSARPAAYYTKHAKTAKITKAGDGWLAIRQNSRARLRLCP